MNIKREEAFTLIEVMLSIVLITLILGVLFNLNLSGWKFWKLNQDSVELSQLTTLISTNLDRKIRSQNVDEIEIVDNNLNLDNGDYNFEIKNNDLKINNNGNERILINDSVESSRFKLIYVEADGNEMGGNEKDVIELKKLVEDKGKVFDKNNIILEYKITLEKNNRILVVEKKVKPRI